MPFGAQRFADEGSGSVSSYDFVTAAIASLTVELGCSARHRRTAARSGDAPWGIGAVPMTLGEDAAQVSVASAATQA
ncbi:MULTISPECIES: hypothetical protein [unclassified Curtobacterium]|uniref:hypothetical protein n=1 Tax=unclassified Curtobacterium TaxID=257496 RepID=UPI00104C764F|nr:MULTISPECIES: hypothetical protein [unclassified Curtobacterium]TCL78420.1 hypothetical protein EDF23_10443 [Curtobacterium sp. PhB128]TCL95181.1 hypothetical protein EDF29_10443 [Curtobacterium sp. PhB138]